MVQVADLEHRDLRGEGSVQLLAAEIVSGRKRGRVENGPMLQLYEDTPEPNKPKRLV